MWQDKVLHSRALLAAEASPCVTLLYLHFFSRSGKAVCICRSLWVLRYTKSQRCYCFIFLVFDALENSFSDYTSVTATYFLLF